MTQELEAITGHSHFEQLDIEPVPVQEIKLTKKLQHHANRVLIFLWACERYLAAIDFVLLQYDEFGPLITQTSAPGITHKSSLLKDAFQQKRSLIEGLRLGGLALQQRIEAQISVTRSLVTERDSQLNIEIGQAAKRDSTVMRGIALVTLIFLPATFAATFFSMTFFRVDDNMQLSVNKDIWLYPLVTVPLTMIMGFWYLKRSVRDDKKSPLAVRIRRFLNRFSTIPLRKDVSNDKADTGSGAWTHPLWRSESGNTRDAEAFAEPIIRS